MTQDDSLADFSRTLKVRPETTRLADVRRFVEEVGEQLALDAEQQFDLKVAVSEACTNAIKHAGRETSFLELSATRHGRRLTFTIVDKGEFRAPTLGRGGDDRGLGLPLMVALMDEVTFGKVPGGGTAVSLTVIVGC